MARKTFTTTIDETTQKEFKIACINNENKMNDVIEAFMNDYIAGKYKLEVEYKIKKSK